MRAVYATGTRFVAGMLKGIPLLADHSSGMDALLSNVKHRMGELAPPSVDYPSFP
jgi:hypothetical protein